MASTIVESVTNAVNAYPYKNAMKFREEKVHLNYTTFMVYRMNMSMIIVDESSQCCEWYL